MKELERVILRPATRYDYTYGSDPELFCMNFDEIVPAFGFLPSKADKKGRYAPFWDGFQAEYEIQAHDCLSLMTDKLARGMAALRGLLKKYIPTAELSLKNVIRVPEEMIQAVPMEYVQFGCKPSFNVYGMKGKCLDNPRDLKYRLAGGHMHFGEWIKTTPDYDQIVRMLDRVVGVWSVGAAQYYDNPIRRQFYGLAGEYRTPEYSKDEFGKPYKLGVEYRTLSNFWLCHPAITQITWEIARAAVSLSADEQARKFWVATDDEVVECINTGNIVMANAILKRNEAMFKWLLGFRKLKASGINKAFEIGLNGAHTVLKTPDDIAGNWNLDDIAHWMTNCSHPSGFARWQTFVDEEKLVMRRPMSHYHSCVSESDYLQEYGFAWDSTQGKVAGARLTDPKDIA